MVKTIEEVKVPRGKCKSGRIWKVEARETFRKVEKSKKGKSFERHQKLRTEKKRMKELSQAIKDQKQQEKELLKQRQEQNRKRKEENARKAEVVQVITNKNKLKKTRKKALRKV